MKDIVIDKLCKSYSGREVLSEFSLTIPAGARLCLMGPSGCGKTTLLNIVMGLARPDSGTITGADVPIAAVFQEDRLCEGFGASANVRIACRRPRAETDAVLASLGLGAEGAKPVRGFSGGMKRRVAIARALCAEYELLILDEPFSGLDAASRDAAAALIRELSAGKTVLAVSHNEIEAELLGAKIVNIKGEA